MKELFAKIEKIRNLYLNDFDFYHTYRHEIAENLCIEYPNIHIDIMEYYFVRHVNQGLETLRDLPNINAKETWSNIPLQDFTNKSDIDWSKPVNEIDKQLYKKYKLTQDEVDFIEKTVKPMEYEAC